VASVTYHFFKEKQGRGLLPLEYIIISADQFEQEGLNCRWTTRVRKGFGED
jgi:hypothetical protein